MFHTDTVISGAVLKRSKNFRPSAVRPSDQVIYVRPTKKNFPLLCPCQTSEGSSKAKLKLPSVRRPTKVRRSFFRSDGRTEGRTADRRTEGRTADCGRQTGAKSGEVFLGWTEGRTAYKKRSKNFFLGSPLFRHYLNICLIR